MLTLRKLSTVPPNMADYMNEIAQGLTELYGPRAADAYRLNAERQLQITLTHPSVLAFCVMKDNVTAGLCLAARRGDIGQVSFIHVLQRFARHGIEDALIERVVHKLREGRPAGIVSESIPFCHVDRDRTYESLGFTRWDRQVMTAPLDASPLDPPSPDGRVAREEDAADVGDVIADAYRDHPERLLHADVRTPEHALGFVRSAMHGGYGRVPTGFIRTLHRDDRAVGAIVGCEVAPGVGFILQVAVRPEYRGRHLGRQLIRELAQRFREAGYDRMALGVTLDNPALRLYQRLAFTPARRINAYTWWEDQTEASGT
ncbi:MAG: GNAT family N-acetyltransferase [bacterium]|nr:GNAT family N-acetyltransferase [bacterium]